MAEAKKTPAAKAVEEPASKAAPAAKRPASRKAAPSAAAQPATTTPVMKKEKTDWRDRLYRPDTGAVHC